MSQTEINRELVSFEEIKNKLVKKGKEFFDPNSDKSQGKITAIRSLNTIISSSDFDLPQIPMDKGVDLNLDEYQKHREIILFTIFSHSYNTTIHYKRFATLPLFDYFSSAAKEMKISIENGVVIIQIQKDTEKNISQLFDFNGLKIKINSTNFILEFFETKMGSPTLYHEKWHAFQSVIKEELRKILNTKPEFYSSETKFDKKYSWLVGKDFKTLTNKIFREIEVLQSSGLNDLLFSVKLDDLKERERDLLHPELMAFIAQNCINESNQIDESKIKNICDFVLRNYIPFGICYNHVEILLNVLKTSDDPNKAQNDWTKYFDKNPDKIFFLKSWKSYTRDDEIHEYRLKYEELLENLFNKVKTILPLTPENLMSSLVELEMHEIEHWDKLELHKNTPTSSNNAELQGK